MNQQAGPSILVSVLIVGFFAVALFPREPARGRTQSIVGPTAAGQPAPDHFPPIERRPKSVGPSTSGPAPKSPAVATAVRNGERAVKPAQGRVGIPSQTAHRADDTIDSVQQGGSVHASSNDSASRRESGTRSIGGSSTPPSSDSSGLLIRTTSQQAALADPEIGLPLAGAVPKKQSDTGRKSRRAITVVAVNETISDVAQRVYGTTDAVDTLWRANRDALPQRDSPLVPGTLLRTPATK